MGGGGFDVAQKAAIERPGVRVSGEDADEDAGVEHFKRAVAKGRAAHAFGVEVGGLFCDERAGGDGGERWAAADEEDVAYVSQELGELLDVILPGAQIALDGGGGFGELSESIGCVEAAERCREDAQG